MKLLKGFHPSLYSEYLLALGEEDTEGDARGPGGDGKGIYARGLGETFGYPGDAKRLREKSKMKLWKEYFGVHGRNLTCESPDVSAANSSAPLPAVSASPSSRPSFTTPW